MSKIHKRKIAEYSLSAKQLATCNITGLAITINIPSIPSKVLEYQNPYSILKNALDIAKLKFSEVNRIPKEILAGCLLTCLTHYKKLEGKTSSVENNIYLSTSPSFLLHSCLQVFLKSKQDISLLRSLSLDQMCENLKSENILRGWLSACNGEADSPTIYSTIEIKNITKNRTKKKVLSFNDKESLKEKIRTLLSTWPVSVKFAIVLKQLQYKDNVLTMGSGICQKVLYKLADMNVQESISLANLIQLIRSESNTIEEVEEDILERFSDSTAKNTPSKALSLKEILDRKLHPEKYLEEQDSKIEEEETEEELSIEDLEYPVFKHGNCDLCEYEKSSCIKDIGFCYILEEYKTQQEQELLGQVKGIADELGIENNLEYLEQEEEEEEQNTFDGESEDEF